VVVEAEISEAGENYLLEEAASLSTESNHSIREVTNPQSEWDEDIPPPPETFPEDWGIPERETISVATLHSADPNAEPPVSAQKTSPEGVPASRLDATSPEPVQAPTVMPEPDPISKSTDSPPGISYILPPEPTSDGSTIHMITVILRSTGDKTRDVLRVRRIHGLAESYPGRDRFALKVYERNRGYLVEFPNLTTQYCQGLMSTLQLLVGQENVHVEPITFQ
jgi:hypothetical protein